jgi:hypothetical protein
MDFMKGTSFACFWENGILYVGLYAIPVIVFTNSVWWVA